MRRLALASAGLLILILIVVGTTVAITLHDPVSTNQGAQIAPTVPTRLTPATTQPSPSGSTGVTTLPPSHDNDAGMSRAHDQYPDADIDFYQRSK